MLSSLCSRIDANFAKGFAVRITRLIRSHDLHLPSLRLVVIVTARPLAFRVRTRQLSPQRDETKRPSGNLDGLFSRENSSNGGSKLPSELSGKNLMRG